MFSPVEVIARRPERYRSGVHMWNGTRRYAMAMAKINPRIIRMITIPTLRTSLMKSEDRHHLDFMAKLPALFPHGVAILANSQFQTLATM